MYVCMCVCMYVYVQNWRRSTTVDPSMHGNVIYKRPREDINAPDLYIPLMSFITYILLVGFVLADVNRYERTHTRTHTHTHTQTHLYIHSKSFTHTQTPQSKQTHTQKHNKTNTYTTHIRTYTHTHIQINTRATWVCNQ